jgi:hypothetical protein
MKKIITISSLVSVLAVLSIFSSCKNDDISFGNYDYQTVYFADQNPVRTITLGDDVYSTELDNEHKFQIYATLGGVESNSKNRTIKVVVDNDLVKNLYFSDGSAVQAMPAAYYSLDGNTITIPSGKIMGAVNIQLNDAFFNDPKSIGVNYVVPLRMVLASDSILSGKVNQGVSNPVLTKSDDWSIVPKNYTLYAVKNLILTFDDNDKCTVTTNTDNCTASGSGTWTHQGAKKAWGDKDRDLLVLNYEVKYNYDYSPSVMHYKTYECVDSLVMRDRESKKETFDYKYKE